MAAWPIPALAVPVEIGPGYAFEATETPVRECAALAVVAAMASITGESLPLVPGRRHGGYRDNCRERRLVKGTHY
jgi:hypothetical protein